MTGELPADPDIRSSRWGQDIGSRPDFKEEFQLDLNKTLIPSFTRRSFLAGLGAASALPILAACQPQVVTEERVQVVEKEVPVERVVTQVVREEVEKVVTVEVEKAVEVEKVVTVEVEKAVEVVKREVVEVEKEVIVEKEKVVTVAPVMMEKKVVTTWGWVSLATAEDWAVDGVTMGEAFQEETGIIQEHVPVHWSRYNDALKAAVPAGVGPNAFENNWSHISPMASEEFIAPLQDYAVSEWGSGWKDLFVAGLIRRARAPWTDRRLEQYLQHSDSRTSDRSVLREPGPLQGARPGPAHYLGRIRQGQRHLRGRRSACRCHGLEGHLVGKHLLDVDARDGGARLSRRDRLGRYGQL